MAHQIVALHEQQLGIFALCFAPPFFEAVAVDDIRRDARIEKHEHFFFIHQHIGAARLVLQLANLFDQRLVMQEELRLGFKFARHQGGAYENFS